MPSVKSASRKDTCTNSGNLLAILRLLVETNQTLKELLDNPIAKSAQYSPQIQNEIIGSLRRTTKRSNRGGKEGQVLYHPCSRG